MSKTDKLQKHAAFRSDRVSVKANKTELLSLFHSTDKSLSDTGVFCIISKNPETKPVELPGCVNWWTIKISTAKFYLSTFSFKRYR